jgi:membrane protease YdiL (CAAX protease family)
MFGILIEVIASWLVIWLIERKDLSVLGLMPSKEKLGDLAFGIVVALVVCTIYYISVGYLVHGRWEVNPQHSPRLLLVSSWWTLKSVLFEELIFRGVLLYILIRRLGMKAGCFISAFCFGAYHWFTQNAFGDAFQMIMVFMLTAIAGLMFAYSYAVTRSLYLPIALHFGWNFASIVVFSNGPLGQQFLILQNPAQASVIVSIGAFLFQVLALPLIVAWYLRRKWKQNQSDQ